MTFLGLLFLFNTIAASKERTWQEFQTLGDEILETEKASPELSKKVNEFTLKRIDLEIFENNENKTDALNNRVEAHLKKLSEQKFQRMYELSLSYFSFQKEANLKNTQGSSKLITTSNVVCIGGSNGVIYEKYHYGVDWCAFFGKGNVGSQSNTVIYNQYNIDAYGMKISPSAGLIFSSNRNELGLKLPILYTHQKLSRLQNTTLREGSELQALTSFYYLLPIQRWSFQMEFGKFLSQDTTLWGFSVGLKF